MENGRSPGDRFLFTFLEGEEEELVQKDLHYIMGMKPIHAYYVTD